MTSFPSRLVVLLLLSVAIAPPVVSHAQTVAPAGPRVETLFIDASAKETAVRKALSATSPAPSLLKAVRTVVGDYENLVRRFPTSAYCDDALWRAAKLSADAFDTFRDAREQTAAVRLFQAVAKQYSSSKFSRQAPVEIAAVSAREPAVELTPAAGAPITASFPTAAAPPPPMATSNPQVVHVSQPSGPAGPLATIKDIRRATMSDIVRVVIELDREVIFRDERIDGPTRVFVDLAATDAVSTIRDQTIRFDGDTDLVRQVRLGRHANNTTRVVLEAAGVSSYSVYPLYSPFRLVIDCLRAQPAEAYATPPGAAPAAVVPKPVAWISARRVEPWARVTPVSLPAATDAILEASIAATTGGFEHAGLAAATTPLPAAPLPTVPTVGQPAHNLAGGFSIARQLGLGVSRIVIDPGHGGHDPGAKGGGTTEADVVLDVALRLEAMLSKAGISVVLTRRSDAYVPLEERTAIANREGADLFLSIHANASNVAGARGVETYFLNFATNLSAAAVAARENAASGQTMSMLPDVVRTIALNNKLAESKDFATYVQSAMMNKLRPVNSGVRDLGVKQAPFVVLIGAGMPSVLTEISFITNVQDARLLKTSAYRQRAAEALFEGIRKYQGALKNVQSVAQKP